MWDIPLSWLQRPLFYSGPVVLHYFYSSFLWTLDKDKNANNVSFVIPANTRSFCGTAWPVFTLLCVWMALWAHSRCGDFIVTPVSLLYCCWCYNIAQCFVQQYNRSSHNGSCDWGGAVFLCPESGVFNLELFPVRWGSVCFVTVFSIALSKIHAVFKLTKSTSTNMRSTELRKCREHPPAVGSSREQDRVRGKSLFLRMTKDLIQ